MKSKSTAKLQDEVYKEIILLPYIVNYSLLCIVVDVFLDPYVTWMLFGCEMFMIILFSVL